VIGHFKQLRQYVATNFGGTGPAGNPETVSATRDFDVKAAFDLPQVFIKLAAEVGKAAVIGGLENDVSRNLDSTQNVFLEPL
jgi:hypothetical protein